MNLLSMGSLDRMRNSFCRNGKSASANTNTGNALKQRHTKDHSKPTVIYTLSSTSITRCKRFGSTTDFQGNKGNNPPDKDNLCDDRKGAPKRERDQKFPSAVDDVSKLLLANEQAKLTSRSSPGVNEANSECSVARPFLRAVLRDHFCVMNHRTLLTMPVALGEVFGMLEANGEGHSRRGSKTGRWFLPKLNT